MNDKPRKPLSLKPKAGTPASPEDGVKTLSRNRKRVIRRDELPAANLTKIKPKPKPKPKPKKKPRPTTHRPTTSPSAIRLDNLNASLNAFAIWREYQPLALGIEKALFQHIAKHSLSSSKRVVQRLLHQHTHHERYLKNLSTSPGRYHLDGTTAGPITQIEREQAGRVQSAT